jgi:hypothetical protein
MVPDTGDRLKWRSYRDKARNGSKEVSRRYRTANLRSMSISNAQLNDWFGFDETSAPARPQ